MEGHYFYHNVKKVRYYQVRQTNIETIDSQFMDSLGNRRSTVFNLLPFEREGKKKWITN